jgi:hypothetical protein
VPGGFARDAFTVDLQANTVTCPAGHTVAINAEPPSGVRLALWPLPAPQALHPHQDGKTLNMHSQEAELAAARRRVTDPTFQASYRRWRPMVERSIAWSWSQTATAGSATAAGPATSSACQSGWPRSTCAG